MVLKKYIRVAKNTWQEIVVYRLNFVMWRLRLIIQVLTMYFLWLAIIPQNQIVFGYSQKLMLTYILGTSLVNSIVFSSRTVDVGDEINQGNLSNFLIRPINYFYYWFAKDIGDKAMNLVFALFELSILFLILRPNFFLQTDPIYLFFAFIAILLAMVMYFFINFVLGMVGFWTQEIWSTRFLFTMILIFFSGGLFPLDILPKEIFSVLQYLPFNYLLFIPLKIYLGQISFTQILFGFLITILWIFVIYQIMLFIWKKGLKTYTAYGR